MKSTFIIIILFSAYFVSCNKVENSGIEYESVPLLTPRTDTPPVLTETQAVEFAEKFIERNGYTDSLADRENLAYESIEWESNVNEMLEMSHNTLVSKAFGVCRGRKGGSAGWTVVFKYKHSYKEEVQKNGRAVTMNLDGTNARVEHVDFILSKVEKRL